MFPKSMGNDNATMAGFILSIQGFTGIAAPFMGIIFDKVGFRGKYFNFFKKES